MSQLEYLLNAGNSHVQIFQVTPDRKIRLAQIMDTPSLAGRLHLFHENTAAASVVPALTKRLKENHVFTVSTAAPLPFAPSKLDFSTVGADRLANAAALLKGPLPAVSIDFGTAITFEVVTKDGAFEGGAILPGRALLRKSLHDYTAQLPLIDFYDEIPPVPGENTLNAMRLGTDLGVLGAVEKILDSIAGTMKTPVRKVACGGDRAFFLKYLKELEDGTDLFTAQGILALREFASK